DPVKNDAGRVAAFLAGNYRRVDPLAPDLQLLDRCRPERIARGKHHSIILLLEQVTELSDRRGLARAIDSDHQDDVRPGKTPDVERLCNGRQYLLDFLGEDRS